MCQIRFLVEQTTQSSQYRIARIAEDNSDEMIFDMRASYNGGGDMCTVHYFIGDEDDVCMSFTGDVRAIIEDVSEGEELQAILLDSGAGASIFSCKHDQRRSPSGR